MSAPRPIEPGCVAVLVRALHPSNVDKLVRVVVGQQRPGTIPPQLVVCPGAAAAGNTPWVIESLGMPFFLPAVNADSSHAVARTSSLRRIDDAAGDDETLRIAGRPPAERETVAVHVSVHGAKGGAT